MVSLFGIISTPPALAGSFSYYLSLATGQLEIWNKTVPIKEMHFKPKELKYIQKLQEVLAFAKTEGLNVGRSYEKFVRLDRDAVSYIVVRAPRLSTEALFYEFPILGKVPYKGFFKKEDAINLANEFEKENLDVYLGNVRAFSMLGIVDDPIINTMLDGPVVDFADTILHELTHRTLWVDGGEEFNETLASFSAKKLTLNFLKNEELTEYLHELRREDEFGSKVDILKKDLSALYSSPLGEKEKLEKKTDLFLKARAWGGPANNAQLYIYQIYGRDNSCLESLYQASSNFRDFIKKEQEIKDCAKQYGSLRQKKVEKEAS